MLSLFVVIIIPFVKIFDISLVSRLNDKVHVFQEDIVPLLHVASLVRCREYHWHLVCLQMQVLVQNAICSLLSPLSCLSMLSRMLFLSLLEGPLPLFLLFLGLFTPFFLLIFLALPPLFLPLQTFFIFLPLFVKLVSDALLKSLLFATVLISLFTLSR